MLRSAFLSALLFTPTTASTLSADWPQWRGVAHERPRTEMIDLAIVPVPYMPVFRLYRRLIHHGRRCRNL